MLQVTNPRYRVVLGLTCSVVLQASGMLCSNVPQRVVVCGLVWVCVCVVHDGSRLALLGQAEMQSSVDQD